MYYMCTSSYLIATCTCLFQLNEYSVILAFDITHVTGISQYQAQLLHCTCLTGKQGRNNRLLKEYFIIITIRITRATIHVK